MAADRPKTRPSLGAVRTLVSMSKQHPGPFGKNLRSADREQRLRRSSISTPTRDCPGITSRHFGIARPCRWQKGILHPDDARKAIELGVDAIIVSNHGGRQVDNAIASLDALITIREAVGPQPTILLDSGIRSGTDVLIGLALGANACLLGRPYIYGLALDGEDRRAPDHRELLPARGAMGLLGVRTCRTSATSSRLCEDQLSRRRGLAIHRTM